MSDEKKDYENYPVGYLLVLKNQEDRIAFVESFNRKEKYVKYTKIPLVSYDEVRFILISFGQEKIHYISLARQGKNDGASGRTSRYRLNFFNFVKVKDPFELKLLTGLEINFKDFLFDLEESKPIATMPPENWERMIEFIKAIRPEIADEIEERLAKTITVLRGDAFQTIAQEQDAVFSALEFSKMDNIPSKVRLRRQNKNLSYLSSVISLNEDKLIDFDSSFLGEWNQVSFQPSIRHFEEDGKIVTVINVNREIPEKVLGVDLIYHNRTCNSYVMIQYKKIVETIKKKRRDGERMICRPDKQFYEEMDRMEVAEKHLIIGSPCEKGMSNYRLNNEPFYWKFCLIDGFRHYKKSISGRYIPNSMLSLYLKSDASSGPNGGKIIKDSAPHIENEAMLNLIQQGLVGTVQITEEKLNEIIYDLLEKKHSVILAESKARKS